MLTVLAAPVAHNLKPTKHLAHTEEANGLSANYRSGSQCLPVHVSYPGEEGLRAARCALGSLLSGGHEARGIAGGVAEWLEIGLNGLHSAFESFSIGVSQFVNLYSRRCHATPPVYDLAQLACDARVVDRRRDHTW